MKATDLVEAPKLLAAQKDKASTVMRDHADSCCRVTIYGPGGDAPPGSFDAATVHVLQQWVSQASLPV